MCNWPQSLFSLSEASALNCTDQDAVVDIAFLVDSSGSICGDDGTIGAEGCDNWQKIKNFLKDAARGIGIGGSGSRTAVIVFSGDVQLKWNLAEWVCLTNNRAILQSRPQVYRAAGLVNKQTKNKQTNKHNNKKSIDDWVFSNVTWIK